MGRKESNQTNKQILRIIKEDTLKQKRKFISAQISNFMLSSFDKDMYGTCM